MVRSIAGFERPGNKQLPPLSLLLLLLMLLLLVVLLLVVVAWEGVVLAVAGQLTRGASRWFGK